MARAEAGDADDVGREIRLVKNPDGRWTARDVQVGISAQGETRANALANLDVVVETVEDGGGREPTDDEIRDLGVDPDTARTHDSKLPDVLK